jgi:hypothetical protein
MLDDLSLTLSIGEINRQLTCIARMRERLRTMLRIAVEAREDAEKYGTARPLARESTIGPSEEAAHA